VRVTRRSSTALPTPLLLFPLRCRVSSPPALFTCKRPASRASLCVLRQQGGRPMPGQAYCRRWHVIGCEYQVAVAVGVPCLESGRGGRSEPTGRDCIYILYSPFASIVYLLVSTPLPAAGTAAAIERRWPRRRRRWLQQRHGGAARRDERSPSCDAQRPAAPQRQWRSDIGDADGGAVGAVAVMQLGGLNAPRPARAGESGRGVGERRRAGVSVYCFYAHVSEAITWFQCVSTCAFGRLASWAGADRSG
jgi:hypothetical protein